MPEFRLYNTLTRTIEPFAPADGKTVSLYTCGPTVYNPAHLGNFRTFLFEDLLRRTLRLAGWNVKQVMNLTDVEDKIIRRASDQGVQITDVTRPVEKTFHEDRKYLRIEDAESYPRATESIKEMIALVRQLIDKGVAYLADDGSVYFAISKYPQYGKLSRLDTREVQARARVSQDEYTKENAQDFVLWKSAKPEDEACGAAWDSPWGRGRPGWHLECSAMAMAALGRTMDIHCGGVDLIFPHHEDEIAQSEAATGVQFSRFWCHGEFLLIDGTKMAKRIGNVSNVSDLREQGISAAAFRHFVFSTHYRKQLNLIPEAVQASMEGVRRVGDFAERLEMAIGGTPGLAAAAEEAEQSAIEALFDDLNAPGAVGALFTFIRKGNAELDRRDGGGEGGTAGGGNDLAALARAREVFARINSVLDIIPDKALLGEENDALARHVEEQIEARKQARATKDFARADQIRKDLEAQGVVLEDSPTGTRWKRVQ